MPKISAPATTASAVRNAKRAAAPVSQAKSAAAPASKTTKPAPRKAAPVKAKAPAKTAAAKPVAVKKPAQPVKAKATPSAPDAPVSKPLKIKAKLVRDSFAMPASDFALIDVLKERALGFRRPTKKSELLRAGLKALSSLTSDQLSTALNALEPLKPGRPKKDA